METLTIKPAGEIGNAPFMSAEDLAAYSARMRAAKALKEMEGQDRAGKAREELVKQLSQPVEVTPEKVHEITQMLLHKLQIAAEQGAATRAGPSTTRKRAGPRRSPAGRGRPTSSGATACSPSATASRR
jgi:hypothetical protein